MNNTQGINISVEYDYEGPHFHLYLNGTVITLSLDEVAVLTSLLKVNVDSVLRRYAAMLGKEVE